MHPILGDQILNTSYICTDTDTANVYCLYEWNFESVKNDENTIDYENFLAQYRSELGNIENEMQRLVNIRHNLLSKIIAYQYVIHDTTTHTFRVKS